MKFKVGDRVRIICLGGKGSEGVVDKIDEADKQLPYRVVVEECTAETVGIIWWKAEDTLELVESAPEKNLKDSNPKDAIGCTKAPVSALPWAPIYEIGLAMLEGACKYGRHNYRVAGVRGSIYVDAAIGHIVSWWEGEDIDPESGINHLMKAAACLVVARDSMIMGNFNDDRPPKYPSLDGLLRRDPRSKGIIGKYPIPHLPFTQKDEEKKCERPSES